MNISTSISITIFKHQTLSLLVKRHFLCASARGYVRDDRTPGDQTSSKFFTKGNCHGSRIITYLRKVVVRMRSHEVWNR